MFKSVLVEFEDDKVKSSDWQAEIDRVYKRKWDEDPKYEASARCGALRAVIEIMGRRFDALAKLYNKTLVDQDE